jgi:hypothetical protein
VRHRDPLQSSRVDRSCKPIRRFRVRATDVTLAVKRAARLLNSEQGKIIDPSRCRDLRTCNPSYGASCQTGRRGTHLRLRGANIAHRRGRPAILGCAWVAIPFASRPNDLAGMAKPASPPSDAVSKAQFAASRGRLRRPSTPPHRHLPIRLRPPLPGPPLQHRDRRIRSCDSSG